MPRESMLPNQREPVQGDQGDQGDRGDRGDHGDSRLELTPRELEVIELVAEGLSNREVAQRLCRSPRTIENHLRSVYQKLDVRNRVEMIRVATDLGLLDVPGADTLGLPASELELKGHALDLVRALDGHVARAGHSQYFVELAKALTKVLGVRWAGMTEPIVHSDELDVICMVERGELMAQCECRASISPCGPVLRDGQFVKADGLMDGFPNWDFGREVGLRGYVGVRLDDHLGRPVGTLWVMDSEPIERADEVLLILRLFRGRTGAELALAQLTDRLGESGATFNGDDITARS